jgi:hypothetical protein
VPEGWEIIRIGTPELGESYLDYYYLPDSDVQVMHVVKRTLPELNLEGIPLAIVQRKAHWQKLWPMQWRETPLQGRFRNHIDSPWEYGTIVQYRPGQMKWKSADNRWWQHAEVRSMDVPQ